MEAPKNGKEVKKEIKAKKEKKASPKKENEKKEPSNKRQVYDSWVKSGKRKEADTLHKEIGARVKLSTVRSWVAEWSRGINFPAGVGK